MGHADVAAADPGELGAQPHPARGRRAAWGSAGPRRAAAARRDPSPARLAAARRGARWAAAVSR